jgi:succinyl-CoA synthetase beta subunit
MSRVKISEYRAKKILIGETYKGIQLKSGSDLQIPDGAWVAKVDQGIKKRFKQGLVSVNKPASEMLTVIRSWEDRGFSQFLLEPFLDHEATEEQYFALERVREGIRMLHTREGGVDIEAHPEAVQTYILKKTEDITAAAQQSGLPGTFLSGIIDAFNTNFLAFLEINPLVVRGGGETHLLDAAVLVDSAASFFVRSWSEDDVIKGRAKHAAEGIIEALAATTPASLKLSVINPNGALFFLLSGGGGSIVIADEAELEGAGKLMANYGEYSGGPTREETYLYSKQIVQMMLDSTAGKKALVIAGGVANFTDVKKTFLGIIDALKESADALRKSGAKVFVRRGGPNEAEGLSLMKTFLEREQLLGSVHGSDEVITKAIEEAIAYVKI